MATERYDSGWPPHARAMWEAVNDESEHRERAKGRLMLADLFEELGFQSEANHQRMLARWMLGIW